MKFDLEKDPLIREIYSKDASIFQVVPESVAFPKSVSEIQEIVKYAYYERKKITPRGAATGITGGCLGEGIVIDLSRYLDHIISVDSKAQTATVEPGVVLDDLNRIAGHDQLQFAPETSTSNRATLGGMAANNAAGARSIIYGKTVDHILEIDLILDDGSLITFQELSEQEWKDKLKLKSREGDIYRACERIRTVYKDDIEKHFPKIERRVSGYNLDELLKFPLNLSKLIVGSEGTLGVISRLKLNLIKKPLYRGLTIVHFHDMLDLFRSIDHLRAWHPSALEMLDHSIIDLAKSIKENAAKLFWLKGDPSAILIVEFEGNNLQEVKLKVSAFEADLRHHRIGYAYSEVVEPAQIKQVWDVRKGGLGLLMSKRSYQNACAFIEDMAIDPSHLYSFMDKFISYIKKEGKEAGIYGHVGSGCMHIRPYLDLRSTKDLNLITKMMEDISSLVIEYGGALSGEHGDGIIRSGYNEKMFGPSLYKAFIELKEAFDPFNIMNPGKIVGGQKFPSLESKLKIGPDTVNFKIDTFYDFSKEGGFELAIDMCNGNGQCRKSEGLMCPSYQASHNEYDDTRARANALQSLIHQRLPDMSFENPGVRDVLDLCISCKGCKTECPSQVDMAKMKGEFMYHFYKVHGLPLRTLIISRLSLLNRWAFPSIYNTLVKNELFKRLLSKLGFSTERTLPTLANTSFSNAIKKIKQRKGKPIVLFNDTYTEFNNPQIGLSAVRVLNYLGYEVTVPPHQCCGRPAYSKGVLEYAKSQAEKLVERLKPYSHLPILILEPSCFSALTDELNDLHLSLPSFDFRYFDDFIAEHAKNGNLPLPFLPFKRKVWVHGHCHQKALIGMQGTLRALKACPNLTVEEIHSGCCGMAGSFGYETEHVEFSKKIGELKLLPAVRSAKQEDLISANGFSCRTQIEDGANRKSLHTAEIIASLIA